MLHKGMGGGGVQISTNKHYEGYGPTLFALRGSEEVSNFHMSTLIPTMNRK